MGYDSHQKGIAPENRWLEDDPASFWASSPWKAFAVSFREGKSDLEKDGLKIWKPRRNQQIVWNPPIFSRLFSHLRILHLGTIALLDKARGNVARDSIWWSLVSATLKCASRLKRSKKLQKLHDFSGKSWFSFCLNKDSASTSWVGSMDPKKLRVTASSTICPSSPGATGWESAMKKWGCFLACFSKESPETTWHILGDSLIPLAPSSWSWDFTCRLEFTVPTRHKQLRV